MISRASRHRGFRPWPRPSRRCRGHRRDARMTGSGACVFAAFPTEREAHDALAVPAAEYRWMRGADAGSSSAGGVRVIAREEGRMAEAVESESRGSERFWFPLGSRQVVRHRILIPAFVGSIPTSPAIQIDRQCPQAGMLPVSFLVTRTMRNLRDNRCHGLRTHAHLHRQREPQARGGRLQALEREPRALHRRSVLRRRGDGRADGKRPRPRRVRPAVHVRADQRQPDGNHGDGRCAQARVGGAHHRGHPLFRLCAAGPPAAFGARRDHGQGRRRHAEHRRRQSRAW